MDNVDYHVHTDFSDGQPSYRMVLDRARELNMDCIAVTDHFDPFDPRETIRSITEEKLLKHFEDIKEYAEKTGLRVLCGIETCTDLYGDLRVSSRVMDNCDLIITSLHYLEYEGGLIPGEYFNDRFWESYKDKLLKMAAGPGDILGHCEAYLAYGMLLGPGTTYEERRALSRSLVGKYFDEAFIAELIKALSRSGKALELHCVTSTPREEVIKRLIENKVPVSLGSDAHLLHEVGNTNWGRCMLEKYNGESLLLMR